MSTRLIEVTEAQAEIFAQAMEQIDKTATLLAGMPYEDRLAWLKEHQYSHPISFEREIGGTIYTVNAHFSEKNTETVEGKTERIICKRTL